MPDCYTAFGQIDNWVSTSDEALNEVVSLEVPLEN